MLCIVRKESEYYVMPMRESQERGRCRTLKGRGACTTGLRIKLPSDVRSYLVSRRRRRYVQAYGSVVSKLFFDAFRPGASTLYKKLPRVRLFRLRYKPSLTRLHDTGVSCL